MYLIFFRFFVKTAKQKCQDIFHCENRIVEDKFDSDKEQIDIFLMQIIPVWKKH